MRNVLALCLVMFLVGCGATLNSALTPSLSIEKDSFDGSLTINQPPVSSASSMSEAWHTLGFQWNEKYPDTVFLTVGVQGIHNVTDVAFNVDGEIIDSSSEASKLTKFDINKYSDRSERRLAIPLKAFEMIARGKLVKMKVTQIDTYTVSSFGTTTEATVGPKFDPFLSKVHEAISKMK
jgi:predicted acylesterase/phospholipase RssA